MKFNTTVAVGAFFIGIAISASAQDNFLRPEVSYVLPSNNAPLALPRSVFGISSTHGSLKGTAGFGLDGGFIFGEQDDQEIGISIGTASSKGSNTISGQPTLPEPVGYNIQESGTDSFKMREIPILINYRFYVGTNTDAVRFYIGVSGGITNVKETETLVGVEKTTIDGSLSSQQQVNQSSSRSSNPWTLGPSLGVTIRLANKIDLDVGYRYLYGLNAFQGTHVGTSNLYAAANFRF